MMPVLDATEGQAYYFFIDWIIMRNALAEHRLQLRDYDSENEDPVLGEVKFIPYHTTNGFPQKMVFDNGGNVVFTIEVEYTFPKEDR
jgi:hypothetical protein